MMRVFAFALVTTVLAGCATRRSPPPTAARCAPGRSGRRRAGSSEAEYGTFGFDTAGMDKSVAPGRQFLPIRQRHLGQEHADPGRQVELRHVHRPRRSVARARPRQIIEEQAKDPNSKIGAAYASFMDEAAVEAKGLAPFQPWLEQVRGLKSRAGLARSTPQARSSASALPSAALSVRTTRPPISISLQFFQAGLGMPDRDYYLSKDPKLAETKAKYVQHLTNMLTLAGETNAAARAKAIVAFEDKIAAASWTRVESRDATKTYNKMTLAQLAASAPGFDFRELIRASGARRRELGARRSAERQSQKIAALVGKAPLGVLKDQLLVRSLDAYAPYLPSSFDKENFAFYGTTLSGTPEQEVRWKRGGELHRRHARRRRQQALRRAVLPAGDEGSGGRAGPQHHRRDGPAHRQARAG